MSKKAERDPALVELVKALSKTRSLTAVAAELARLGYRGSSGKPLSVSSVYRLLG